MTYSEKLKDQRWQKKRLQLLEASGWRCEHDFCANANEKPTLNVHHRIYLRGVDPWDYEDWAYQVVCDECHPIVQSQMEEAHKALAKFEELRVICATLSGQCPDTVESMIEPLYNAVLFPPQAWPDLARAMNAAVQAFDSGFTHGFKNREVVNA